MTVNKVFDFIKKNDLIKYGDKVLIGLSGGADSVCLTHILYTLRDKLGIELYAAHLNHGIRAEEAVRDENFARQFSDSLKIKFFVKHADIKNEAKRCGISEELCGRNARYNFFKELSEQYNISDIATAHSMNDNAETILMNFMRGASINGLCGIPVKRGNVIRPILCLTRDEIIEYINYNKLSYVTDSTNLKDIYTRNKIRLNLIPEIEKNFNSNFIETTVKNSENIRNDKEFLDNITDKEYNICVIGNRANTDMLRHEHISIRRRILYKMLINITGSSDISMNYIDDMDSLVTSCKTGRHIDLPNGTEALIEYGSLIVRKKIVPQGSFGYIIDIGVETDIQELGIRVLLEETDIPGKNVFTVPDNSVFEIRNRRDGDYFYPVGMQGKKKIKNYFIDEKVPRDLRNRIGIFTVNGEIAYIIGKRRDRRFAFKNKGVKLIIKEIRR